eukprot:GHVS01068342.1.p2 GENE.GHVS01068342.1~~GHVS01068342.1.p2  ORF type:complete len:105 (+),score=25.10 GHVS01068342.1:60-374(+)
MNGVARRFVPLLDRVLVQKVKAEGQTKSGLFLPESAKQASNIAKVVAVGPGRVSSKTGERVALGVAVGDVVVIPEYGGMPVKLEGGEADLQVFRDDDIVGILKD